MDDIMDKTCYGIAALRKFGTVPAGFHIYCAEMLGSGKPNEWTGNMRVTGAQFKGRSRIPHTTMTTIVTREEILEVERTHDFTKDRT